MNKQKIKKCTKCKKSKNINLFSKNNRTKDKHCGWCKECRKKYNDIRIKNNIKNRNNIKIKNKKCTKCKEIKNINNFYKDNATKDGHNSWCKKCVLTNKKKYNKFHKKEISKKTKIFYNKNKNEINKIRTKRYKEDFKYRNKHLNASKKYYKKNIKKVKKYKKKYNAIHENKINISEKRHINYIKNKPKILLGMKKYRNNTKNNKRMKKYIKKWAINNSSKILGYRLKRIKNINYIDDINKLDLLKKYNFQCPFIDACGGKCIYGKLKNDKTTHISHLHSIARHAKIGKKCPHSWNNVVPMRDKCNESMHDKTPLEFMWGKIKEKNK